MKLNLNEVVTIDFETYYDSKYSLRAKVYNTSSYIMDPQFQIHCCAIKIGTKKSKCYWGREAIAKAGELGFCGLYAPESAGGLALPALAALGYSPGAREAGALNAVYV